MNMMDIPNHFKMFLHCYSLKTITENPIIKYIEDLHLAIFTYTLKEKGKSNNVRNVGETI